MKQEIIIDPKDFASLVVSSHKTTLSDLESVAKEKLALYLMTYTLIERYNKLEKENLYGISTESFKEKLQNIQLSPNGFFRD